MRAVVTGAAGFVGSHLCEAALERGWSVVGVDNFVTSVPTFVSELAAREPDRFRFVEWDVSNGLPQLHETADVVFHFASPASPKDYARFPLETLRVNSHGTEACCEWARERGARVIYASTSEIYGDPLEHPQRETYWGNVNTIGPRSCYDEGKRYGEAVVSAFARTHALDTRIVRIFNTYGPRMRKNDGRVVPEFIAQALEGLPLTLFGGGEQTRSLCYVSDLVEGLLRFAEVERPRYTVINLGNDAEVSVRTIGEIIARLCRVPFTSVTAPLPADDPTRRRPSIERAREMLGWEPRVSLEDGLRRTIEWFTLTPSYATRERD